MSKCGKPTAANRVKDGTIKVDDGFVTTAMRIFLITLTVLLGLSGQALHMLREPANSALANAVSLQNLQSLHRGFHLLHLWLSWLFLVVLPLYAWEHVRQQKHWLKVFRLTSISGVIQLLSAVVLIASGLLLFLFDPGIWPLLRDLHYQATFVLLLGLVAHRMASKHF